MIPRLSAFTPTLLLLSLSIAVPAAAQPSDVADVSILATNSIDIKDESKILSGEVVVNDASAGPTLVSGVELNVRKKAQVVGISADSIAIAGEVGVSGSAFCNELGDSTGTVACAPLTPLPVFAELPVFKEADVRPEAADVLVGANAIQVLAEGDYGDIIVAVGTVVFSGGIYNVRSITTTDNASVLFDAPSEIRVEGKVFTGKNAIIGPSAGAPIGAADIVFYVGGINGVGGGITEKPAALMLKDNNTVAANIYAPRGRVQVSKESAVTGAILAADIHLDKKVTVTLDSAFANLSPIADDKDVFTADQPSIAIVLSGTDPEGAVLTFAKASDPSFGSVILSGATATYTPADQFANVGDSFTYTATDPEGAVSAPATVLINPTGDPTPPPTPLAGVLANGLSLERVGRLVAEDPGITIRLTGAAPCDPTGAPDPENPCDGLPTAVDDVPLTFAVTSNPAAGTGTLSTLNQGTGELQEPAGADEVPQRSAWLVYTPPVGFTGVASFTFSVEGDVDGSGGINGAAETATATVQIDVQAFTPTPPVVARDQQVSTLTNTPVNINLSGGPGQCDPSDPDCRPALAAVLQHTLLTDLVQDDTGSASDQLASALASTSTAGALTIAADAALAGERLFAIDSNLNELFELSPANATSVLVGSTAAGPSTPASLAFDGVNMYSIDLGSGGLYTLNLNTGAPTLVCGTAIIGWQGLASDPTDEGQFYGITQSDDLYRVDRATCTTTQVNATAGTGWPDHCP
jgi:hypothetical protein